MSLCKAYICLKLNKCYLYLFFTDLIKLLNCKWKKVCVVIKSRVSKLKSVFSIPLPLFQAVPLQGRQYNCPSTYAYSIQTWNNNHPSGYLSEMDSNFDFSTWNLQIHLNDQDTRGTIKLFLQGSD